MLSPQVFILLATFSIIFLRIIAHVIFHDNQRKLLICQNVGINHQNGGCNIITYVDEIY